jgi:hypothetical protein
MKTTTSASTILYDGSGAPIYGVHAPSIERMFESRPECRIIFDRDDDRAAARDDVDLILCLPADGGYIASQPELAQIVACLDHGGRIAVHGITDEQVQEAIAQILTMAGGGNA